MASDGLLKQTTFYPQPNRSILQPRVNVVVVFANLQSHLQSQIARDDHLYRFHRHPNFVMISDKQLPLA